MRCPCCQREFEDDPSDVKPVSKEGFVGFQEKGELIIQLLDKIKPIPENTPIDMQETIDVERQILVMRAGWGKMSVTELRALLAK